MKIQTLLAMTCLGLMASLTAYGHCLVIGSPDARVQSQEGLLTPLTTSRDCQSLRLVSGTAKAIWTLQDGQTGAGLVRAGSPPDGYPGNDSTSPVEGIKQAWAALNNNGVSFRAGYKRFSETDDTVDVFVEPSGLRLPLKGPGVLTLHSRIGRSETVIGRYTVTPGQAVRIPASALVAGTVLRVEFQSVGEKWQQILRPLPMSDQQEIAKSLQRIHLVANLSQAEQQLARSMVFELFGMSFNRDVELATL